jgi:hypothetical protein
MPAEALDTLIRSKTNSGDSRLPLLAAPASH